MTTPPGGSPPRPDGTVYRGAGAYAYVMAGGQLRAVPDATTLRALGHAVDGAPTLQAAEIAQIPAGAAYPSTSTFLTPPASTVPLVLLPVRLETHFATGELWVRVFPDTVHINSFEPALTEVEVAARTSYLAISASDPASRKAAFAALARQFGAPRAAYIASSDASTAIKAADWTIAPFTNVLPERWIVLAYGAPTAGPVVTIGRPIADAIAVGPAPNGSGPASDDGMMWLSDFDRAVANGMGVRIPLPAGTAAGFDRLVVLGLRSTLAPADSSARLAALLQAHQYSDGLALLPLNAATNNTETTPSAFSTADPDFDALYAIEQEATLCPARPTADGDRLARTLSIPPSTFAHVTGANGAQDEQAHALNTVLWPTTWGYYLEQLVTGAVPNAATTLPSAREHFIANVRARGHYPAFAIGRQPYGMLPVCSSSGWKSTGDDALETQLAALLAQARATWEASVTNIPRIVGASDVEAALVAVLGMTPTSNTFVARGVIGPEYAYTSFNFAKNDLAAAWWSKLNAKTTADAGPFATALSATRLASATYAQHWRNLGSELVAAAPLDGQPAPAYVAQLGAMGWEALRDAVPATSPAPILFFLLRHAALRAYVDAAFDLLIAADAAHVAERLEVELVGFGAARSTAWDVLNRTLPGRGPVGLVLDAAKSGTSVPAFAAFWSAFATLPTLSANDLDAATREVFDLSSYRLDAWITSLAYARLVEQTQTAGAGPGIVLGGYGWLEDVRPQTAAHRSNGFIHAPSVDRAASAAVLRSGYLAHAGEAKRPFSIDLSSKPVRLGLHLLDGMREGQSLGALLGYRFERTLHDAHLDRFIDAFRAVAPAEVASGLDVVDGLALVRAFATDANFWTAAGLPATGTPERTGAIAALETTAGALDAVADLALAESVHQLTRGNVVRAGATLDAIARGDAPPLDIDFVRTPRSGFAATYRVMTFALDTTAPGWAVTPRAAAEPRLNAWAAALLGDPARVRIRVRFALGAGAVNAEFGFDRLAVSPLDALSFSESDGTAGELVDRIRLTALGQPPAGAPAGAPVEIVTERDPAWPAGTIALGEWLLLVRSVARLANGARAVEPGDLAGPNDMPPGADDAELQARADTAEANVRTALAALQQAPRESAALIGAAAFGVTGAIPSTDATAWAAQAASVQAELASRVAALDKLAADFNRAASAVEARIAHDVARMRAVFGASFVVLPALTFAASAAWSSLWANSVSLQDGNPLAAVGFLQRAARVRAGIARMDAAVMLAESLAGKPFALPDVAQLPHVANDRWAGCDTGALSAGSALSLVGFTPAAPAPGMQIAGLMVDEWMDVFPATDQTTGVAFDYADPTARPPQAILLAVAPDTFPEWTLEAVEGSLREALDLAKLRGVDPDALGALGHFLPALYFPYNAGESKPDVPSIDFTAVRVVDEMSLD